MKLYIVEFHNDEDPSWYYYKIGSLTLADAVAKAKEYISAVVGRKVRVAREGKYVVAARRGLRDPRRGELVFHATISLNPNYMA